MATRKTKSLNKPASAFADLNSYSRPFREGNHVSNVDVCTDVYFRDRRAATQINNLARKSERQLALIGWRQCRLEGWKPTYGHQGYADHRRWWWRVRRRRTRDHHLEW